MPLITTDPLSHWTDSQWDWLRAHLENETGMELTGSRFLRLRDAVLKTVQRGAAADICDIDRLQTDPERRSVFVEQVTAELTIGESFFFRNEHHFHILRTQVLPEILRENEARREVRIWSAGCAGGEEPYSLAIVMDQALAGQTGWTVSILGTDLNPEFLNRAREAVYRPWSFRQTTIYGEPRYFARQGDAYHVREPYRSQVRFQYLNLVKDGFPSAFNGTLGLDLILFRNVAIYLKHDVTGALIERFHDALRPGGWLLLGETDIGMAPAGRFQIRRYPEATLYQRSHTDAGPAIPHRRPVTVPAPAPVAPQWIGVPVVPEWTPLPFREGAAPRPTTPAFPAGSAPPPELQAVCDQAEREFDEGRTGEACAVLTRVVDHRQRASVRLGFVRHLLERAATDLAREQLAIALQEDDFSIDAHLLQATLLEEAGDLAAAEQAYRRALYLDRDSAIAHFHLARIQQERGSAAAARLSYDTVLRLSGAHAADTPVPHGDGVCYGRLRELATMLREAVG